MRVTARFVLIFGIAFGIAFGLSGCVTFDVAGDRSSHPGPVPNVVEDFVDIDTIEVNGRMIDSQGKPIGGYELLLGRYDLSNNQSTYSLSEWVTVSGSQASRGARFGVNKTAFVKGWGVGLWVKKKGSFSGDTSLYFFEPLGLPTRDYNVVFVIK
ncbi:MAG: hypothetical protein AAF591_07360 [Verrucomicrobiota bacterium]